jgi:flagellar biosynthesis protein FliR
VVDELLKLGVCGILAFCRIGTVLIFLPGFSNTRIPVFIRIIAAITVSAYLVPFLSEQALLSVTPAPNSLFVKAFASEIATGLAIGFAGYCYLHAVRFAGMFITNMIGMAGIPGQPVEGAEPSSHVANLLNLAVTLLVFSSGLHLLSIRAMLETYQDFPMGALFDLSQLTEAAIEPIRNTSLLSLQISSPFIVLSVVTNFALGVAGKFTPRVATYFAFSGATIIGGLLILTIVAPQLAAVSVNAYGEWLSGGMH